MEREKYVRQKIYGDSPLTVLINPQGEVAFYWDNVKAKGHAEKVKEQITKLQK